MKLNDIRPTIETSGELEEQFFSIQDQGMIFDILRNKMYSNPVLAICREISCNARDAHREVGTPDIPIEIHLPTSLEPFYKIKDFGPGISPDRMSNIFIKYTASTKRDDNVQTGGFGLGAKTPFSYSDTFTIVTNYDGIQYNYACFIDETKVGKLALLAETKTTEPNGTEIIIPVQPYDFRSFSEWTELATRHWDVKPIIKGGTITYQNQNAVLSGDDWKLTTAPNQWEHSLRLIIDGIEYPIELSALKKYADSKMIDSSRCNMYLYFGIGELSLSASREQVYLDEMTQTKIRERLVRVESEIRTKLYDKIESFDNLWLANIYYRSVLSNAFHNIKFLGPLSWRGIPLSEPYVNINCKVFSFMKGKYSRKYGTDPNKVSRSNSGSTLHFNEDSVLFINDLPIKEPSGRHVKKAFEDDPNLKQIQVICPSDKVTEDDLNTKFHLDQMVPRRLSEITTAKGRSANKTSSTNRLLLFKLDSGGNFKNVKYSSSGDDTNLKVLCMLKKDEHNSFKAPIINGNQALSYTCVNALVKNFPDVSFYGVDSEISEEKIDEHFSDFIPLEEFVEDKIISQGALKFVEIKLAKTLFYKTDDTIIKNENIFRKSIVSADSFFLYRMDSHKAIQKLNNNFNSCGLLDIYEAFEGPIPDSDLEKYLKDHPEFDLESINKKYQKKYPLVNYISHHRYHEILVPLIEYINLIDSK
jgi:hypothetical protein